MTAPLPIPMGIERVRFDFKGSEGSLSYKNAQAENFLDEYQGYANGRKEKNLE